MINYNSMYRDFVKHEQRVPRNIKTYLSNFDYIREYKTLLMFGSRQTGKTSFIKEIFSNEKGDVVITPLVQFSIELYKNTGVTTRFDSIERVVDREYLSTEKFAKLGKVRNVYIDEFGKHLPSDVVREVAAQIQPSGYIVGVGTL